MHGRECLSAVKPAVKGIKFTTAFAIVLYEYNNTDFM